MITESRRLYPPVYMSWPRYLVQSIQSKICSLAWRDSLRTKFWTSSFQLWKTCISSWRKYLQREEGLSSNTLFKLLMKQVKMNGDLSRFWQPILEITPSYLTVTQFTLSFCPCSSSSALIVFWKSTMLFALLLPISLRNSMTTSQNKLLLLRLSKTNSWKPRHTRRDSSLQWWWSRWCRKRHYLRNTSNMTSCWWLMIESKTSEYVLLEHLDIISSRK